MALIKAISYQTNVQVYYRQQLRDFLTKSKEESRLWVLWFVFMPIVPLVAYMLLGYVKVLPQPEGIPAVAYISIGMMMWLWLSDCLLQPNGSYNGKKGYFIRGEISLFALLTGWLPERVLAVVIQFLFVLLVLWYLSALSPQMLGVAFIIWLFSTILFISIGLMLALVGMIFPDLMKVVQVLVRFLMFVSLVIFPLPDSNFFYWMKVLNPFAVFISDFRYALVGRDLENIEALLIWSGAGALLAIWSLLVLSRSTNAVRDYLQ